jgi:hypothetical protein
MTASRTAAARGAARRRTARLMARLVLAASVAVAVFAPIAWERLPDFKAIKVPGLPAGPGESAPGPGIDPAGTPRPGRLIQPEATQPPSPGGDFKYFSLFGGRPPFVSTCQPIAFVIRRDAAPADGASLVFSGLQQVANATGVTFRWAGFTDDVYRFNQRRVRFSWENDRTPLWIGWATDAEVPDLGPRHEAGGYAVGVGGPTATSHGDGQEEIIGGGVVLRAGEALPLQMGPGETAGNVLLHELGHAMGLDHAQSRREEMFPSISPDSPDGYGPGDQRGLEGLTKGCSR